MPIDCIVSPWINTTECSEPCGGGIVEQVRGILAAHVIEQRRKEGWDTVDERTSERKKE